MGRPVEKVEAAELQRIFNDEDYWGRVQRNEWLATLEREGPARPGANQPPGTRSQMLAYHDLATGHRMAMVHQYLKPDGTLGASGMPDPKRLYFKDRILYC